MKTLEKVTVKTNQDIFQEMPTPGIGKQFLYSGPLPPSTEFGGYEKTLPGAANRILTLAEDEARHRRKLEEAQAENRRELERKTIHHNIWLAHIGQIFAFCLGITGLGGAIYSASLGQQWLASIIGIGGLASLIGPFLKGWKSEKK